MSALRQTELLTLKVVQQTPFNAEAPLRALAEIPTPSHLFYVRSNFEIPKLDPASWQLTVTGAVATQRRYGLADLSALEAMESLVLLECAGNGRRRMVPVPSGVAWDIGAVGCALFRGVPLRVLLDECGVGTDAVEVLFVGADCGEVESGRRVHFERSLPLDVASNPGVLLATHMNGEPLAAEHGFPLRLVVPGWYGVSSVKWLTELRVLTHPFHGAFQGERYVYIDDAQAADGTPVRELRVRALIADPADGAALQSGQLVVRGLAWSGYGRITVVEVSFDEGANWQAAELAQPLATAAPTVWSFVWNAPRGAHVVMARATDETGNVQPIDPLYNRMGYGNNVIQCIDVTVE